MSVFRVRVRAHSFPRLGEQGLSAEALAWVLPDADLIELVQLDAAVSEFAIAVDRDEYLAATNEIIGALQTIGYSTLELTISEWVDRRTEAMVFGVLSGALGSKAAKMHPAMVVTASALGALIGHWLESQIRPLEIRYRLVAAQGGWKLAPIASRIGATA